MVDVAITAANVISGASALVDSGKAGATITAGHVVYLDSADGKYKLVDADNLPSGGVAAVFIALNGASDNQPIQVLRLGDITIGGTLVAGTTYCASDTPGGIAPQADITTGDSVITLGAAKSASVLAFRPIVTGVTL